MCTITQQSLSDILIYVYAKMFSLWLYVTLSFLAIGLEVIQPPIDFYNITFDELTDAVQLMCSLNIDIPSSVTVVWIYNSIMQLPNELVSTAGNTTTLVIRNPQPSDAGEYTCVFREMNIPVTRRFIELS